MKMFLSKVVFFILIPNNDIILILRHILLFSYMTYRKQILLHIVYVIKFDFYK